MMMSKPSASSSSTQSEVSAAKPSTTTSSLKKSPHDAVADLERRLAELSSQIPSSGVSAPSNSNSNTNTTLDQSSPPSIANSSVDATSAPIKGGKNALLARIMAAQERAKQVPSSASAAASTAQEEIPPPTYTEDLLADSAPPPSFEAANLTPLSDQSPPPPVFDDSLLPPSTHTSVATAFHSFDPLSGTAPSYSAVAPTAPSAPSFEDLDLMGAQVILPPPVEAPAASITNEHEAAMEAILGLQGLSAAEKHELLEEQKRIMAAIEANKTNSVLSEAAARADAFEQRSFSANVPGAAKRSGGGGGGGVVGAADYEDAAITQQMLDDMALAEALQQEEYKTAENAQQQRRVTRSAATAADPKPTPTDTSSQGWMEWLGISSAPTPTATKSPSPDPSIAFAQPPPRRGYQAVSLPPGASSTSTNRSEQSTSARLMPAQTDEIVFEDEEDDDLLLNRPARVAAPKPLFSCVADSITNSVSSLYTTTLPEDEEGNVHGVDSSSLLAVTNYRRVDDERK